MDDQQKKKKALQIEYVPMKYCLINNLKNEIFWQSIVFKNSFKEI